MMAGSLAAETLTRLPSTCGDGLFHGDREAHQVIEVN